MEKPYQKYKVDLQYEIKETMELCNNEEMAR